MKLLSPDRQRINSIDVYRGIVMIVMALDHVRDFFYKSVINNAGSVASEPTNLDTTTPQLFFTRWITHFCAPAFVFLAGTSIFLMAQKKSKNELSIFLLKRGVWLLILEATIITLGWTFNPLFSVIILQVIWAIGMSMILMALFVQLPYTAILITGLIIFFGHNLLSYPEISDRMKGGFIADATYFSQFALYTIAPQHFVLIVYAFLPWTGLMLLGYCFGKLYTNEVNPVWRRKILLRTGAGLLSLFLILRIINSYGDPVAWSSHDRGPLFTFLSFLNVNKYPPSLDFLSVTIGVALLMLALLEPLQNKLTAVLAIYGRVPLFYYLLHFYFIHILVVIFFFINGHPASQIVTPNNPFLFRPPSFGFNLLGVYAIWIFIVIALYPLCKKYDRYKRTHKKWWLSYL
jgi:uncharacterized membrane protein